MNKFPLTIIAALFALSLKVAAAAPVPWSVPGCQFGVIFPKQPGFSQVELVPGTKAQQAFVDPEYLDDPNLMALCYPVQGKLDTGKLRGDLQKLARTFNISDPIIVPEVLDGYSRMTMVGLMKRRDTWIRVEAQTAYTPKSILITVIMEPKDEYPTSSGIDFRKSIRLK
jgi:hypothetical protein